MAPTPALKVVRRSSRHTSGTAPRNRRCPSRSRERRPAPHPACRPCSASDDHLWRTPESSPDQDQSPRSRTCACKIKSYLKRADRRTFNRSANPCKSGSGPVIELLSMALVGEEKDEADRRKSVAKIRYGSDRFREPSLSPRTAVSRAPVDRQPRTGADRDRLGLPKPLPWKRREEVSIPQSAVL